MKKAKRATVPKQVSEDLDQRDLAVRRIGSTARDQLRWIVHEFARRDLTTARPEELVALGYDLRALPPPLGTLTRSPHAPLPVEALKRIHGEVNTGLRRLLAKGGGERSVGLRDQGWVLQPPARLRIARLEDGFMPVSYTHLTLPTNSRV